jgi:hypothetical protein
LLKRALLGLFIFLGVGASASAQLARGFVSVTGDDGNSCSRLSPCRTIYKGYLATAPNGEIIILDSGDYQGTTITTSVTISAAPGVQAAVTSAGGGAVFTINAGSSDRIVLRGLEMDGSGGGPATGILIYGFGSLVVEHCVIHNMIGSSGIQVTASGYLSVKDTEVRDCGYAGIDVAPESLGPAAAVIESCRIVRNVQFGIRAADNASVAVIDSVLSWNGSGARSQPLLGVLSELNVYDCLIHGNKYNGVENIGTGTSGGGTVRVADSLITDNEMGLAGIAGSSILTRGDNTIEGNSTADLYGIVGTYSPR